MNRSSALLFIGLWVVLGGYSLVLWGHYLMDNTPVPMRDLVIPGGSASFGSSSSSVNSGNSSTGNTAPVAGYMIGPTP